MSQLLKSNPSQVRNTQILSDPMRSTKVPPSKKLTVAITSKKLQFKDADSDGPPEEEEDKYENSPITSDEELASPRKSSPNKTPSKEKVKLNIHHTPSQNESPDPFDSDDDIPEDDYLNRVNRVSISDEKPQLQKCAVITRDTRGSVG